ncbi:hypothetical protein E2320_000819, partial [Naja naja]
MYTRPVMCSSSGTRGPTGFPARRKRANSSGERKGMCEEEEEEEAGLGQQPVEMPAEGKGVKQKASVSQKRPPEGASEAVGENPEQCQGCDAEEAAQSGSHGSGQGEGVARQQVRTLKEGPPPPSPNSFPEVAIPGWATAPRCFGEKETDPGFVAKAAGGFPHSHFLLDTRTEVVQIPRSEKVESTQQGEGGFKLVGFPPFLSDPQYLLTAPSALSVTQFWEDPDGFDLHPDHLLSHMLREQVC